MAQPTSLASLSRLPVTGSMSMLLLMQKALHLPAISSAVTPKRRHICASLTTAASSLSPSSICCAANSWRTCVSMGPVWGGAGAGADTRTVGEGGEGRAAAGGGAMAGEKKRAKQGWRAGSTAAGGVGGGHHTRMGGGWVVNVGRPWARRAVQTGFLLAGAPQGARSPHKRAWCRCTLVGGVKGRAFLAAAAAGSPAGWMLSDTPHGAHSPRHTLSPDGAAAYPEDRGEICVWLAARLPAAAQQFPFAVSLSLWRPPGRLPVAEIPLPFGARSRGSR